MEEMAEIISYGSGVAGYGNILRVSESPVQILYGIWIAWQGRYDNRTTVQCTSPLIGLRIVEWRSSGVPRVETLAISWFDSATKNSIPFV